MSDNFARTPAPPYYAVIFPSQRKAGDHGYGAMADEMVALAMKQDGYLGHESVRGTDGFGITVSYWKDEASIATWKANAQHLFAQEAGKQRWYEEYITRVARVDRAYSGPTGRS